jgi:cytochrome P450
MMSLSDAAAALVDPSAYADGRLEQAVAELRAHSPVHLVDVPGFRPFYALTRHADIHEVESDGDLFQAAPRYRLFRAADDPVPGEGVTTLVRMDGVEHTAHRGLVASWFRPSRIRQLQDMMQVLARAAVDTMAKRDDAYDFVAEVAMQYPLTAICGLLGVPAEDQHLILRMTQNGFGVEDEEYQRATAAEGEATMDFVRYFAGVVADRLENPADDLSTALAHATLEGDRLPAAELFAYFGILATAGHDTTSSTIAGGLRALIEDPSQLDRLRAQPELIPTAVEEMIRWVSPVKLFMRTASADTEVGGQRIKAGESVLLLYPAANRDPAVFDDPDRFDVGRDPNRHLAFGYGAHFCLGAHLARLEAQVFFAELIPRLRSIELAGKPELIKTLFVGGLKHLPIRAEVE